MRVDAQQSRKVAGRVRREAPQVAADAEGVTVREDAPQGHA